MTLPLACMLVTACNVERDYGGESSFDTRPSTARPRAARSPMRVDELSEAFKQEHILKIEGVLNDLKMSEPYFELSEVVACAYVQCDDRDEDWNPLIYESSRIRVDLLDHLTRNQRFGIEHDLDVDFRSDALQFLGDKNPAVYRVAMFVVARVGTAEDVPEIEQKARDFTNEASFRLAVTALHNIEAYSDDTAKAQAARDSIDRLYGGVEVRRQQWLLDTLSQLGSDHPLSNSD